MSPHLDDAVYSAGAALSAMDDVVVVTMLAGRPDPPQHTEWDRSTGFASSSEALDIRRAEDEKAVATLGARAVHLDFLDQQYGGADLVALSGAVSELVETHRPQVVIGPLGVRHADHLLVRNAVLAARVPVPLWMYADLPYCNYSRSDEMASRDVLRWRGCVLDEVQPAAGSMDLKRTAVECYPTQNTQFDMNKIVAPERFWAVTRDL
ncbi:MULTISPECIES: PIG-L deacetylase family protein [unclassified Gordonia (in: high G+C Gram-positive bacteria)]|uniref:PIG-L deacetylase family protein n=1 Tax=unclassified Gordonia (in: high G+C Gram-positive bacteria) TaxID=2657482 RepID=UPI0022B22A46|nr:MULTISPECIES: PIG-L family deacetylase [unclassified Gordonia (in: high G+C Gram-positive bacteria)]